MGTGWGAICHVVDASLDVGAVLLVRQLGDALLFEAPDRRLLSALEGFGTPSTPEERVVRAIHETAEKERQQAAKRHTIEGRLQDALGYLGAELTQYQEANDRLVVNWRIDGRDYRTVLNPDGFVNAAGICLAGRQYEQNLTSIVNVMNTHHARNAAYPRYEPPDYDDDDYDDD